jgi:hypothetical protein
MSSSKTRRIIIVNAQFASIVLTTTREHVWTVQHVSPAILMVAQVVPAMLH